MRVFYFNANELSDNEIEKIVSRSEEHRADRYKKAASEISGRETLCAGFLLRYAVSRYASVPFDSVRSAYDSSGRPILTFPENVTHLYVSLTHTQGHIFCSVSDIPAGIDAEMLREFENGVVKRFFNDGEQAYLRSATNDEEVRFRFFEIWTTKEACFKQGSSGAETFTDVDFLCVNKKTSMRYGDLLVTIVGDIDSLEREDVTKKALKLF